MSASFAGGDGLLFSHSSQSRLFIQGGVSFVAGWFRPTALTAGNVYWRSSTTASYTLQVASTTSELTFILPLTTTSRQVTTNSAGIAVDTWHFIVCVVSGSSTVSQWIFVGTENTPPQSLSLTTNTAGSGNSPSTVRDITLGSGGSAGTYFSGQISQIFNYSVASDTTIVPTTDFLLDRFVLPLWAGTFDFRNFMSKMNAESNTPGARSSIRYIPLNHSAVDGSTEKFPAYLISLSENVTTELSNAVYLSSNSVGTPVYSAVEPALRRRDDFATSNYVLPPLMRL